MKITLSLLTLIGCGLLTLRANFADENQINRDRSLSRMPGSQIPGSGDRSGGQHSKLNDANHAYDKGGPVGPVNIQIRRTSLHDLRPTVLSKGATVAQDGLLKNKTENHFEQAARLPVGEATTALSPSAVGERVASVASIGGLAASSAKNSASVLNGTGMKLRP